MDYTTLTAKELQELCRSRDLPTARAKADMIKTLQEDDASKEIEEFYGDEPAPLPDGVLPASEDEVEEVDLEKTPEPVEDDTEALAYWVDDGGFTQRYDRHGKLDDREHRHNLEAIREAAEDAGFTTYGPAFRVTDPDSATWVYRINVR